MFYIVGLGNPGEKYQDTRHNVGFMILDWLREKADLPKPVAASKYAGDISEGMLSQNEIILLYPNTYMNNSGSAVRKLVPKGEENKLLVIYDDVDLPIGEFKLSAGRGAGGHNGVDSIIASLGTKDFARIRVGIAPKSFWSGKTKRPVAAALNRHVLGRFAKRELNQLNDVKEDLYEAILLIINDGMEKAMNKYN